jgi:hypothetical protein
MTTTLTHNDILQLFEDTYEALSAENGVGLDPDALRDAHRQVLLYWEKLGTTVAAKITETEVPLSLMGQRTPGKAARPYAIYGVVDVVQEGDTTTLYDIKSHPADSIKENRELYAAQLNIYAHIWQKLHDTTVARTCIIATDPPEAIKHIRDLDKIRATPTFQNWDPIVVIPFNQDAMAKTIHDFGTVVDLIEDHVFTPLTIDQIQANATAAKGISFCRKCDARFSCRGYRAFANLHERGQAARSMSVYYDNGMDPDEYESRLETAMSPFNEIAADTIQDA